ncbi:uncharacterized protein (TIGR03118 family) [Rhodoferax ferrireducens]|uniref:Uncharacterized protein (TIGR03118 family) n=1 Tax=Rhodoferax ferrireducens TaxID=192843 RepID=A0ABU2C200_9BURK|nr:TIGR03118 family protein [Rhodoferax ferrireducens]MDR7375359.1 uncharacterized protein (TIGR03118 family) [Rhodoferax ferrireducens]
MVSLRSIALKFALSAAVAASLTACGGGGSDPTPFKLTALVSDGGVPAANTDANLKNGWGIAFNPQGVVWVADAGSKKSTLYDGNGVPQQLVVAIPDGANGPAGPTGIVFSGASSFPISQNGVTGSSAFLFATLTGTIAAWSPTVNLTNAVTAYDDAAGGAEYTGLAIGSDGGAPRIYAADFHNNKVDVFDNTFQKLATTGRFTDPALPAGFAPFGIQAVGDSIVVAYAQQDSTARISVHGSGLGFIDIYDTSGNLKKRLASGGALNAPWGLAAAPANFGPFSNALLVGNFGDGTIHAYDLQSGKLLGALTQNDGTPITVPGLWGIAFGNGLNAQPTNTLFLAAGPNRGANGLYARIDLAQ